MLQSLPHSHDLNSIRETIVPVSDDPIAVAEQRAKFSDHKRKERVKNTINWVFVVFIIIASSITIGVISVRLMHLVLPITLQWLSADQIQGVDKLFFSGAIGGFLVSYFKKSSEQQ